MHAGTSGGEGKVFFAGHRSQPEIAELMATHDCLVLPTLIESGGAVLLEAMAMGLPVISTDWGGPADYVDDSCGILVPLDFVSNWSAAWLGQWSALLRTSSFGADGQRED